MKSRILTFIMASFFIVSANLITAKKADAIVSLIIKNKTAATVGGIATGTSAVVFFGAAALGQAGVITFTLGSALLLTMGTAFVGAVGLIVLDDKTVVDIQYRPIDYLNTEMAENFSLDEIQMYNAELVELNAIRKTIQAEMTDKNTVKDANRLWNSYKDVLHPATIKIAELKAQELVSQFKVK